MSDKGVGKLLAQSPVEEIAENLGAGTVLDVNQAIKYLAHYGYIAASVAAVGPAMAIVQISSAIQTFQLMAGIPQTGLLDQETVFKMSQPRCGVPDFFPGKNEVAGLFQKMVEEARWRKTALTYYIGEYVNGIIRNDQVAAIAAAFKDWVVAADGGLTKIERIDSRTSADIVILTGSGPSQGFDGPSGTLAYAYLPNGSDRQLIMRFDLAEQWTLSGNGVLFRNVACHEFGHLLGLDHSRVATALMAPFYSRAISVPQNNDDIARIRALYPRVTPPAPPPDPPPTPPTSRKIRIVQEIDIDTERQTMVSVRTL